MPRVEKLAHLVVDLAVAVDVEHGSRHLVNLLLLFVRDVRVGHTALQRQRAVRVVRPAQRAVLSPCEQRM